ncbi:hypothetical protein P9209_22575 [Prescottella defluvii]|nr:hypothetical protein P9209_22575 [Prescottella defluvii]
MNVPQRITVERATRSKNASRRRQVFVIGRHQPDGRYFYWRLGTEEAFQLLDGLTDALDEYEQEVRR